MWKIGLVSRTCDETLIEFTTPDESKFVKRYTEDIKDIKAFMQEKVINVCELERLYKVMQGLVDVQNYIANNWSYKVTYVNMPADWVEYFVDFINEDRVFSKMYSINNSISYAEFKNVLKNEIDKVSSWINDNDMQGLSQYFGQEVTL